MSTLHNVLQLLLDCIQQTAASTARFSGVLVSGVAVAMLAHCACFYSVRLWNRKFHMKLQHHFICGVAGLVTLFFMLSFHSLTHVEQVVKHQVDDWREHLENDGEFNEKMAWAIYKSFKERWPAEQTNPKYPPPSTTIPDGKEKDAAHMTASAITKEAAEDFDGRFPVLRRIIGASQQKVEQAAKDSMLPEMISALRTPDGRYRYKAALVHVAHAIESDLSPKVPRVVVWSRAALVVAFLLIQAMAFGLVGWLGQIDIQVKTSGGVRR